MSGSNKKKRPWVIDLILVLLIISLGYVLYTLVGGDWNPINQMGSAGDPGPFGGVAESVGAFGRGLRDMFGSITP